MKWNINSILSVLAMVLALATAPMSAAFADENDLDEVGAFGVMGDSDSEDGSIHEIGDSEDGDSEDVDSQDSDSVHADSEDSDSEDSDDDLDDSDSDDDSEEDEEMPQ